MNVAAPQGLTASRLRLVLSITTVLIILAGGGIFYLAYNKLDTTAAEVGERVASAKQSESTVQRLESLQEELELKRDTIDMTSQVVADSQNYAYQDRLVNDLTVYANRANLRIRTISFSSQAGSSGSTPATPSTPEGSPGSESGTATTPPASAGLKKATVDITLESPLNYRDLLNFLHYVEQNLTKLKVSKVSMTKSDAGNVTIDVLNLEVYLK